MGSSIPKAIRRLAGTERASRPGTELEAQGHTRTDNSAVMLSLVQHGVGIGRLMDLLALPLVARGELVPVLAHAFAMARVPIFAVMLQERHRLPKIRACIDYWAQWLARMVSQPVVVTGAP